MRAFLVLLTLSLVAIAASTASAATIYVPDDYPTIQQAVDAANAGDTIIVRDGVYAENVDVGKRLTIRSENGSANCIVQAANSNDHVFYVTAYWDWVNISGFTITGASGSHKAGIFINAGYGSITGNNISGNEYGIYLLYYSSNSQIKDNKISGNEYGIYLYYSDNNQITNNEISNNGYGICIYYYSDNNQITNNSISNNGDGIDLYESTNNQITNNEIFGNHKGIVFSYSDNNQITNNEISGNCFGITLIYSTNNQITNNEIFGNDYGIAPWPGSTNNQITNNEISENGIGITLWISTNNQIYLNNFVNNSQNVYSEDSTNIWNSTQPITYYYNSQQFTNYLGNYWSDYAGSDADGDGIGDTPYTIDSQNKDYHPLISPKDNYRKQCLGDCYADNGCGNLIQASVNCSYCINILHGFWKPHKTAECFDESEPLDLCLAFCPQCCNGVDDDFDGLTDYPADEQCTCGLDPSEETPLPPIPEMLTLALVSIGLAIALRRV